MTFQFKKGDTLVPKTVRTFNKLVYPKMTVEAFKDKNYVLKTSQGKLVNFSFIFIENNYEKESAKTEAE